MTESVKKKHGIPITVLAFIAFFGIDLIADILISPVLPGWSECVRQVFFRLPVALLIYRRLGRDRPADSVRTVSRRRFRTFALLYLVFVQIPTQAVSPIAQLMSIDGAAGPNPLAIILNTLVLAPVIEETVFRGMLFNLSRTRLGFRSAALVNAVLFSILHYYNPLTMVTTFIMTPLFCAFQEATGSVRYGIRLHLAFNVLSLAAGLLAAVIPVFVTVPMFVLSIAVTVTLVKRRTALMDWLTAEA